MGKYMYDSVLAVGIIVSAAVMLSSSGDPDRK